MITTAVPGLEKHSMECMEVWGGNRMAEDSVSVVGMDVWVLSLPHDGAEAGGDIHYVSMCFSGHIARFTVADVSGHGDHAADLAVRLRHLMKKNINRVDQTRFARALNEEFGVMADQGRFATAVLATFFAPARQLILCNAGHPPPLWYRVGTGQWTSLTPEISGKLEKGPNLPLGIIEPTDYYQFAVPLALGDLVLLHTDPLIEATNAQGNPLGVAGLSELLGRIDPDQPDRIPRALVQAVQEYQDGRPLNDDVTILLLRHSGAEVPPQGAPDIIRKLGKLIGLVRY